MNSKALCSTLHTFTLGDFEHKFSEMTHFAGDAIEERENGIGHLETTRYTVIGPCPLYLYKLLWRMSSVGAPTRDSAAGNTCSRRRKIISRRLIFPHVIATIIIATVIPDAVWV